MRTRSGRQYYPGVQHDPNADMERMERQLSAHEVHKRQYGKGGLWGYNDHDYCHRHRPEDEEPKTIYVPAHYRRKVA